MHETSVASGEPLIFLCFAAYLVLLLARLPVRAGDHRHGQEIEDDRKISYPAACVRLQNIVFSAHVHRDMVS